MLQEKVLALEKAIEFSTKVMDGKPITDDVLALIREVWKEALKYYKEYYKRERI